VSEEEEKRRPGVPKYFYWGKKPPKAKKAQKAQVGFINFQQKRFYLVQLAFRTAKVTAILVVFLMFFSKL
jgi:hypothetical protein